MNLYGALYIYTGKALHK